MSNIAFPYNARPYFIDFHARKERFAVLVAHRRAGKTEAAVADLVWQALHNPFEESNYAYLAPFAGQAKRVAWKRLKKIVGPTLLKLCKISETSSTITLPNNATIFILGADNYEALRGMGWDGIVLDEAGDMEPAVWGQVILPALFDRLGWAVFIGTPKGHNFFYRRRQQAIENVDGQWFFKELKASENTYLSQKELQSLKDNLDEDDWAQELECSFEAAVKGTYYGKTIEKMEAEGRLAPFAHVPAAPVHVAFDIGIRDDTAAWFFQVVNGRLDVLNHFSESGLSMDEVIDLVNEKCVENNYKLGELWLPHDAAAREWQTGKTAIEQLYAKGYNVRRVPSESVYSGIQAVRHTLPKMRIDGEKCFEGLEALKNYKKEWNDKTRAFKRTPEHDWSSHSADAMRYLCLVVKDQDISASVPKKPEAYRSIPGLRVEPLGRAKPAAPPVNREELERKEREAFERELLLLASEFNGDGYERI